MAKGDIAGLKRACFDRLDYGKSRGVERKVCLGANRVIDALIHLERQRDQLRDALDECLNALIGSAVSAGGCDDRDAILEAQKKARAALAATEE